MELFGIASRQGGHRPRRGAAGPGGAGAGHAALPGEPALRWRAPARRHRRALAAEPDVMVCDEITSALDVSVQGSIVSLLEGLRLQRGISMLFVTHNLALVRSIAARVEILQHGRDRRVGTIPWSMCWRTMDSAAPPRAGEVRPGPQLLGAPVVAGEVRDSCRRRCDVHALQRLTSRERRPWPGSYQVGARGRPRRRLDQLRLEVGADGPHDPSMRVRRRSPKTWCRDIMHERQVLVRERSAVSTGGDAAGLGPRTRTVLVCSPATPTAWTRPRASGSGSALATGARTWCSTTRSRTTGRAEAGDVPDRCRPVKALTGAKRTPRRGLAGRGSAVCCAGARRRGHRVPQLLRLPPGTRRAAAGAPVRSQVRTGPASRSRAARSEVPTRVGCGCPGSATSPSAGRGTADGPSRWRVGPRQAATARSSGAGLGRLAAAGTSFDGQPVPRPSVRGGGAPGVRSLQSAPGSGCRARS